MVRLIQAKNWATLEKVKPLSAEHDCYFGIILDNLLLSLHNFLSIPLCRPNEMHNHKLLFAADHTSPHQGRSNNTAFLFLILLQFHQNKSSRFNKNFRNLMSSFYD